MTTATLTHPDATRPDPRTALITGLAYLALAITGMVGFLLIRPQLLDDNPAITAANWTATVISDSGPS